MNWKAFLCCVAVGASFAKSPEFHGKAEFSTWTSFENDDYEPQPHANHDVTLSTLYPFDEGLALFVQATAFSVDSNGAQSNSEYGKASPKDIRSSGLQLDDVQLHWNVAENATLKFGSFTYAAGGIKNYYGLRHETFYSTIFKEQRIYGFGIEAAGLTAYLGIPSTKDLATEIFLSYGIYLLEDKVEKLHVRPIVNWTLGGGRERDWKLGTEFSYSNVWSGIDYLIDGSLAYTDASKGQNWIFHAEPSLNLGFFSLGLGAYHAVLGKETLSDKSIAPASVETALPLQQLFYVEPMFTITQKIALSFPVSLENPDIEVENDHTWKGKASVHLYPTHNVEWDIWAGVAKSRGNGAKTATGAEVLDFSPEAGMYIKSQF